MIQFSSKIVKVYPFIVSILGLQISSNLFWRDCIVHIAKSASKKLGVLFDVNGFLTPPIYSNYMRASFVPAWNIAFIFGVLPLSLLFLIGLNQRLSTSLVIPPSLCFWTLYLFAARLLRSLLSYRCYFGHCSDGLAASIISPKTQPRSTHQASFAHRIIGSVMVSSLLLPTCEIQFHILLLWLPFFKRQLYHYLRNRMARFFINPFFYLFIYLCITMPFCVVI